MANPVLVRRMSGMDYLNQLIQILSVEKKLYTELKELAQNKQKTIISNDVEQLAIYLSEEQSLIDQIEDVEKERRQAVIGLCTDLDITEKELSFTKLREYLDPVSRKKLDQFKTSLLEILEELGEVNETNRVLIQEAMKINDFTIRILTQASAPISSTYNRTGVDQAKSQNIIDKRV